MNTLANPVVIVLSLLLLFIFVIIDLYHYLIFVIEPCPLILLYIV